MRADGAFMWVDQGETAPDGYFPITAEQVTALLAPRREELVATTLAKARTLRLPIMQVLDGMQASALVNATTVLDAGQTVPLAAAIEARKQALRALPQQVDLSAATTQQQMEYIVLLAYKAVVDGAPAEIKTAFDSLKP